MTLKQWVDGSTKKNADAFYSALKIMNLTESASVCSVEVQQTSLENAMTNDALKEMGTCYLFNSNYSNILFPFVSYDVKIKPVVFVNNSFYSMPEPVMVLVVAYTLFFLDWHLKMRERDENHTMSEKENRSMHYCSMFYSEYESFKLYLKELSINNMSIDIDGLKQGVLDNNNLVIGKELGIAVEYLAQIAALGEWNSDLQKKFAKDKEIQRHFEKKLKPVWYKIEKFFSISRNFEESLSDSKKLSSLLDKLSGEENDLQAVESFRAKSMQAFSEKRYKKAVKYGEVYLERAKKSGDTKMISLAFSNLHMFFSGMEEYSKAEDLMPELVKNARLGKDYIGIAYANANSLSNPVIMLDKRKSIERFNGCLDSILLLSEEEFQKQKQDVVQVLDGLYQYFPFFAGVKEMVPVAEKYFKLFRRAKS